MNCSNRQLAILCFFSVTFYSSMLINGVCAYAGQEPTSISIATEEYPPYTSESLKDFGIDAAIVSAAFNLEGIDIHYKFLPGARSYSEARVGMLDATLPWARREGREVDFYYSDPIIEIEVEHFFFRKAEPIDWDSGNPDMGQLAGLKVGAIIGQLWR
jgi:polar amino acid transport system substrate-binding protein